MHVGSLDLRLSGKPLGRGEDDLPALAGRMDLGLAQCREHGDAKGRRHIGIVEKAGQSRAAQLGDSMGEHSGCVFALGFRGKRREIGLRRAAFQMNVKNG